MPAPPVFQIVVNAAMRSPGGGSGRGVSTTWWPAEASAETVVSTAAAHAGSTASPSIGEPASTPIRSPLGGSMVIAAAKDPGGAGGDHQAAGSWRASASRAAAVSATVRVSTPLVTKPSRLTVTFVTRPRVGFSPTRPVHDAGMRIDPPPSSAWAMGAIPAATAAPAPLDDPPGVRSGSHGLREMPRAWLSVKGAVPNSEVVVLPSNTNPASTNRCTTGSDAAAGALLAPADPWVVGHPATSRRSLTGSGTP